MKKRMLFILFLMFPWAVSGQDVLSGFTDDFSRSTPDTVWDSSPHVLWEVLSPDTYQLELDDGQMLVTYTPTGDNDTEDRFQFLPPLPVDASEWPRITMNIASDTDVEITMRVVYSIFDQEDVVLNISGDNVMHTYTTELDEDLVSRETIDRILFYFDRGGTSTSGGTIRFGQFRVAGFGVSLTSLGAERLDPHSIRVYWEPDDPGGVDRYHVYRGTDGDFEAGEDSKIAVTEETEYIDVEVGQDIFYYYRVSVIDTLGNEHFNNLTARRMTFEDGIEPGASVTGTVPSDGEVGRYETLTLGIRLQDALYENPYDPDEVDLHAWFVSPGGDSIRVNGFYNGDPDWNSWMVRFAPPETGTWTYQLHIRDLRGSGEGTLRTFEAHPSDQNGPLRVSSANSNYLKHHDGSSFYGNAVYYPWNVTEQGLDRLREFDLNMFAYWNSSYDNAGNGGGNTMLESMDSGLGRIDQRKASRIDELLEWAEERDLLMMFAIWPHDWLRIRGQPWDVEWSRWVDENPYSEVFTPEEFYTDEEAWRLQKNQYRYIIARWGHSRAMGIWEVVNEIHGTTGFVRDEAGAVEWTNRMHDYFRQHDYFERPTTASYGSINIFNRYDIRIDMPNRHYYEAQGYPRPYNDAVRDGLYNITNVYAELKAIGDRPATLGEAGYHTMFSEAASSEYTEEFHNAYWSGVAMGMATTPFWWEFNQGVIFTNERMETYRNIAGFVRGIDFAHIPFVSSKMSFDGTKAFGMTADTIGIGWVWTQEPDVSELQARQAGLQTGSFETAWYDTWSGETVRTDTAVSVDGIYPLVTADTGVPRRDIAFISRRIDDGSEASRLYLFFRQAGKDEITEPAEILCYVGDSSGRLVPDDDEGQAYEITFELDGPGSLSHMSAAAEDGYVVVTYHPDPGDDGSFTITAHAEGLEPDELVWQVATGADDSGAAAIPEAFHLEQNYPNPFNPETVIRYQLPVDSDITVEVFDALGRRIATLVDGRKPAGRHEVRFDASNLSSGMYLYRITTPEFTRSRSMTLVK